MPQYLREFLQPSILLLLAYFINAMTLRKSDTRGGALKSVSNSGYVDHP